MEPSINKAELYNSIAAVYFVVMTWFSVQYSKSLGHISIGKLAKSDSLTLKINSVCQSEIIVIGKKPQSNLRGGKIQMRL